MVSSRDGFLFSENAVAGQGNAGAECSGVVCLNTSGVVHLGRWGGGEYRDSRVEWKMFRNCSGFR